MIQRGIGDRKSTRLNSSHLGISYAVFCLKKKNRRANELDDAMERENHDHSVRALDCDIKRPNATQVRAVVTDLSYQPTAHQTRMIRMSSAALIGVTPVHS